MNANAKRPVATGTRRAPKGSGMRALARALLVLPAAVLGTAASAYPHREPPVDECVQAAVARMGVELTQRIEGAARLIGDAETARVVYLDVATPGGGRRCASPRRRPGHRRLRHAQAAELAALCRSRRRNSSASSGSPSAAAR